MHWLMALDYGHWLLLGLILLVLEVAAGRGVLLWTGLVALVTGLLTLFLPFADIHLSWVAQLMVFAGLLLLVLMGWLVYRGT